MLKSLIIENIALIEHLEIDFSENFNVLSGETGAGKSVILNSLSMVLGDKVSVDVIRSGTENAYVEAVFDISNIKEFPLIFQELEIDTSESLLIIRREISRDGKNKCKVNGKNVLTNQIKDISDIFVDIHSQHEHQSLLNIDHHLTLLDSFTGINDMLIDFSEIFDKINEKSQKLNSLKEKEKEKERLLALSQHAFVEIDNMKLTENEETELETELKRANSVQKISDIANELYSDVYAKDRSIINSIQKVISSVEQIVSLDKEISPILDEINEITFKFENIKEMLKNYKNNLDLSPDKAEVIAERLYKIRDLKRKYNCSDIKSLISYSDERKTEVEEINKSLEIMEFLEKEIKELQSEGQKICLEISQRRQAGAKKLSALIEKELIELAMTKVKFAVDFKYILDKDSYVSANNKKVKVYRTGIDRVEFLISTNAGEDLRPLKKIASGGELSRIMLSLKSVLAKLDDVETLVFDEIDAGIGGETAFSVGKKLKSLSENKQIICITHLAQIASMSDANFRVYKYEENDKTKTYISRLDKNEKINEIARMVGGESLTETSINYAKELIEKANNNKRQSELFS